LVEPDLPEVPPMIMIRWPSRPTIATPAAFDSAASDIMRILANAVIELAAIKVSKQL
jgi:hypothetical protein